MSRLPTPGGDDGTWGDVLNDFLAQSHNADGTLKGSAIPDGSVTAAKLSQAYIPTSQKGAVNGVATLDGSGKVPASQLPAAGATPDATTSTKGIIQLAGDLGGTAASPTVPGLASKEPTVSVGTNAQYYRGDKTWQTLDKSAVGLGNVDNTSDVNKPVSTATQTALNAKADVSAVVASTTVDAKGDLLVATGNDTIAKQPVGTDGQVLTADSTQSTGVKWAPVGNFIQGQGIAKMTVGNTAPSSPAVGDVWIQTP